MNKEIIDEKNKTLRFKAEKPTDVKGESSEKRTSVKKQQKTYIFYCVMTLSVMLFALVFTASELFSIFFSNSHPGQMLMSKFFGDDGSSGKSLQEIMLGQSFNDLSIERSEVTLPEEKPNETTKAPTDTTNFPDTTAEPYETTLPEQPDETTEDVYVNETPELPDGMSAILSMDLSLSEYGHGYIHDSSTLAPNLSKIHGTDVSLDLSSVYPAGSPVVLIVHTHGTEAYTPSGINYYDPSKEVARSSNTEENVVSLGRIVAEYLNEKGIAAIHCEIMFDEGSYTEAYNRSGEKIKEYLEKYPSIQYVIDIHRDAVVRSSGELIKAVTLSDGEKVAQMMFVVGTGESAVSCPNWERNLALAQKLRQELNRDTDKLCRPTCLRDSSYNQQYAAYSILLEIGAAGNTLEEAERAAEKAAAALYNVLSS